MIGLRTLFDGTVGGKFTQFLFFLDNHLHRVIDYFVARYQILRKLFRTNWTTFGSRLKIDDAYLDINSIYERYNAELNLLQRNCDMAWKSLVKRYRHFLPFVYNFFRTAEGFEMLSLVVLLAVFSIALVVKYTRLVTLRQRRNNENAAPEDFD